MAGTASGQHKQRGKQPHHGREPRDQPKGTGELPRVRSSQSSRTERRSEGQGGLKCRHDQAADCQQSGHAWANGSAVGRWRIRLGQHEKLCPVRCMRRPTIEAVCDPAVERRGDQRGGPG